MSGARSRNKGANAEREALRVLGDELGMLLFRNLVQTRSGGADCVEIRGFSLEIKRCERLSIPAWWRQACIQAGDRAEPLLMFRQNRKPWRVLVKTLDGHREVTVAQAADHIRDKLARLYGEYSNAEIQAAAQP